MLKRISDFVLSKFRSDAKNRSLGVAKIAEEMIALEKVKEAHQIAAFLSEVMRKNGVYPQDLASNEEMVVGYLKGCESVFFDDAGESWKHMPSDIRTEIFGIARNHFLHKPVKEDIHGLAISGGGGKGQFYVGAIRALEDEGVLARIKTVSGVSAGALTSIPLALGCGAEELADIVKGTDFRSFFIESNGLDRKCKETLDKCIDMEMAELNVKQSLRLLSDSDMELIELVAAKKWLGEMGDSDANTISLESGYTASKFSPVSDMLSNVFKNHNEEVRIKSVMKHIEATALDKNPQNGGPTYVRDRHIVKFLGVNLDKPLKTPYSPQFMDDLVDEIWSSTEIRDYASVAMSIYNQAIDYNYFTDPKDVISIAVNKALSADYIEYFLGDLVKKKVVDFVGVHGLAPLISIHPSLRHHSSWNSLTMAQLGELVAYDRQSSAPIGLKDLVIGVTKAGRFNKVIGSKGVFVASDISKTDDIALSNQPISKIGRMSMSIPYVFKPVELGGNKYIDGGLHHNLPTDYFDRDSPVQTMESELGIANGERSPAIFEDYRFDKNILSIIPATELEIVNAKKVKDIFSSSEKADKMSVKNMFFNIRDKLISVASSRLLMMYVDSYREMDEKRDFRNIIINTEQYGTMSFKPDHYDFTKINWSSYCSVLGGNQGGFDQKSIFDCDYNSTIRLRVAGLKYSTENLSAQYDHMNTGSSDKPSDPVVKSIQSEFSKIKKTQPFSHKATNARAFDILKNEMSS